MSTFLFFGFPLLPWLAGTAAGFLLVFLVALGLRHFAADLFSALRADIVKKPLHTTALGSAFALVSVLVCVALAISVVGIPFAILGAALLSAASYAGLAVSVSVLGAALPFEALKGDDVKQIAAGTLAAFLLAQVPFIGTAFLIGMGMAGLGALFARRSLKVLPHYRDPAAI